MVRPAPAGRDEGVGALGQRRADEELEVAQLVAAERERQQVLALDPDLGPAAERGREARQRLERRRPVEQREAREASDRASRWTRAAMVPGSYHRPMATRISPADRHTTVGQHAGMERSIAISAPTVGSERLYSVDRLDGARRQDPDPPPRRLRDVDLHPVRRGPLHLGPDRRSSTTFDAAAGDFIYIPAGEIHVEANASATEPLVVVLTRNCPDSHVVYLDGGPDGADDVPAPC